jgi:hypothetical protein
VPEVPIVPGVMAVLVLGLLGVLGVLAVLGVLDVLGVPRVLVPRVPARQRPWHQQHRTIITLGTISTPARCFYCGPDPREAAGPALQALRGSLSSRFAVR